MPAARCDSLLWPIGRSDLKWESHTEFVAYSAFTPGVSQWPFDAVEAEVFPDDWRTATPGRCATSVLIRVELQPDTEQALHAKLKEWLVAESHAVSTVVDGAAVIAGDFRIDPAGHMRFAVFAHPSARRIGRIVPQLCKIETDRAMSMLGLITARNLTARLNVIGPQL